MIDIWRIYQISLWKIYMYEYVRGFKERLYYPPPPGGSVWGATERGVRPRQGVAAGVKTDGPAWGLSLSTLTDSWRSPRSSMKNLGEGYTIVNGPL